MAHWIVAVGLDGSPQPNDRLLIPAEVDLGDADKGQPKERPCIARTEPKSLLDVGLGLLCVTDIRFVHADRCVREGQIPIERQGPLAFGDCLMGPVGDAEDNAQTQVREGVFRSQ